MSGRSVSQAQVADLQERMMAFVRAFGLHQPERTPCGRPISVSEAHALGELAKNGVLPQIDLGRRLRLEKSTVSRLVGQLVDRGWVERRAAPDDGRAVLLGLTPSGKRAAAQLSAARADRFGQLLASIPAGERAAVLRALETLTAALEEPGA